MQVALELAVFLGSYPVTNVRCQPWFLGNLPEFNHSPLTILMEQPGIAFFVIQSEG